MKKSKKWITKIFSFIMAIAMVCTLLPTTVFAADSKERWTDTNNYSIAWYNENKDASKFTLNSAADLAGLAVLVGGLHENAAIDFNGKTVSLAASVDLSGKQWTPIGTVKSSFKGSFDGRNKAITGMTVTGDFITNNTRDFIGLFGHLTGVESTRIIENVNLTVDINVSTNSETQWEIGGLAGHLGVNVKNCRVMGTIKVSNANSTSGCSVGGFAGSTGGTSVMSDCSSSVNVTVEAASTATGDHETGGFVGSPIQTAFIDCSATGDVTAKTYGSIEFNQAGGFFGYGFTEISALRCSAAGDVKVIASNNSTSAVAGGFFGKYDGFNGTDKEFEAFAQCVSTGNVTVESNDTLTAIAGGFAGFSVASIKNSYAVGNVLVTGSTQSARTGGFVGQASNYSQDYSRNISSSITNCFTLGSVTAQDGVIHNIAGGFVGNQTGAANDTGNNTLSNCYALGEEVKGGVNQSGAFGGMLGNKDAVLSKNNALSEMKVNGVNDTSSAADGLNGEKFTQEALSSGSAFTGFETKIWEFNTFGIPVLLNVTGQPENYSNHLKTVYTVTFNVNGGSGSNSSAQVYQGGIVTAPALNPTKDGSHFNGWYSGGDLFDFANMPISDNITLTASYAAHTPAADDNDCSTPILCSVCNVVTTAAKSHNYNKKWITDGTTHWHDCKNPGCTVKGSEATHTPGDAATIEHAQVCTVCDCIIAEKLPSKNTIVNDSTDIRVKYEDGSVFNADVVFSVILKSQSEMDKFRDAVNKAAPGLSLGWLYDMTLLKDGIAIQPNGKVKVSIPLTDTMKSMTDLQVVYIDADNVTIIPSEIKDGKIVFVTDHFSYYGVVGKVAGSGNNNNSPQTGYNTVALPYLLLAFGSLGTIAVLIKNRKFRAVKK